MVLLQKKTKYLVIRCRVWVLGFVVKAECLWLCWVDLRVVGCRFRVCGVVFQASGLVDGFRSVA